MRGIPIVAFVLLLASHAFALPRPVAAVVSSSFAAVGELRLEDAELLAGTIEATYRDEPEVLALLGTIAFHRGDYDASLRDLERAVPRLARGSLGSTRELLDIARRTRAATAGFVEARSADGRYVVRFREGRDRLLVPYALDTLRRQDEALAELFGARIPGPIRLEIFADANELAKVSPLSEEAIERTGTIALCKWDKLMITSPAALARGYPWTDTIAHELVHFHLTRAARDNAPVWMQEGFAKYLERAYRTSRPSLELSPAEADLFARKARANALLPFDSFHPSFALLPSQEDASLAYAEVSTLVAAFHRSFGDEGLLRVVRAVADGSDARRAFAAVTSVPFDRYERTVFDEARRAVPPESRSAALLPMRFLHGHANDDVAEVREGEAGRRVRLGDMLWSRGRPHAASVEYARASELAPDDAFVGSRLARSALEARRFSEATVAARRVLRAYPQHEPALAVLSGGLEGSGDRTGAYRAAVAALHVNPFDPVPHCILGRVSPSSDEARRESAACRTLEGDREPAPETR